MTTSTRNHLDKDPPDEVADAIEACLADVVDRQAEQRAGDAR